MEINKPIQNEEDFETEPILAVNRSGLIFYFNEEFYAWYKSTINMAATTNEILDKPHIFLMPPFETEEEVNDYISVHYERILETMLLEYIEDDNVLTECLNEDNFDNWVDYESASYVFDCEPEYELGYEEDEDETEHLI